MFIHPLGKAKTTITNLEPECVQPNAVDLKVSKFFQIDRDGPTAAILTDSTIHSRFNILEQSLRNVPSPDNPNSHRVGVYLYPGVYQFETIHEVDIATGEIGWLVGRSSLARNGLLITSGVYDAGFRGNIGGVIHNLTTRRIFIEEDARIAQLILAKSESIKQYDGQYQDKGVVNVD